MINYVDAHNGGIQMYSGDDLRGWSKSAETLAYIVQTNGGFAASVMGSSSMDFASEEGFDTDDGASLLLKRVFELL